MNLRELEYLVAVADHGHFGRAAAAAGVSQPTLSTQLRKLETELGVALVERGARQHLLTPTGEQIVARARRVLGHVEAIERIAAASRDPRSGVLRLGIFPTLAPYLLPHVMPVLAERLPDLTVMLTEERTPELLMQLRSGRLDAAVLALPIDDEGLRVQPLFREDFLLAVPAGHDLAGQAAVGLGALATEPVLLLDDGHCLRDQALELCAVAGADEREGFRATSLETLRHMVASGAGMTLLPRLAVSPPVAPSSRIAVVPFADASPHRDIALVSRASGIHGELLGDVAAALRALPEGLVAPLA